MKTTTALSDTSDPAQGAVPFFDLQVNGFAGVDFQDPALSQAALRRAVDALRCHRTGGMLLTLITDRSEALAAKLAQIERYRAADPVIAAKALTAIASEINGFPGAIPVTKA